MKQTLLAVFILLSISLQAQNRTVKTDNKGWHTIEEDTNVYMLVKQMPVFGNGTQDLYTFLMTNIERPVEAFEENPNLDQGVYVRFIIEKDGSISNIKVIRSSHKLLTEEAFRLVRSMPKWKPGLQNTKPVRVMYGINLDFGLRQPRLEQVQPTEAKP